MSTFWKWKIPEIIEGMAVFSSWLHSTNCTASRSKWGHGGGLYKFQSLFLQKVIFQIYRPRLKQAVLKLFNPWRICTALLCRKVVACRLWVHWFLKDFVRLFPAICSNSMGVKYRNSSRKLKASVCISPKTKGSVYLITFGNFTNLFQ